MRTIIITFLTSLLLSSTTIASEKTLLEHVREACKEDKEKFCSQVTPGDTERMLACAYAHEDQLSGQCSYALYQAASVLEAATEALRYLAQECRGDVEAHCENVKMGKGRILNCLKNNEDKLSSGCSTALDETVEFTE